MEMIRANEVVQVPNLSANTLLQKFFITSNNFCKNGENQEEERKKEEDKDIELTLGLSLNGQFGTDPRSRKRKDFELGRSSSIPEGFVFDEQRTGDGGEMWWTVGRGVSDTFQLDRTRSLPVEKEMQMETKRKRSEKKEKKVFMDFQTVEKYVVSGPVNGRGKKGNQKNQEVSGMEKARNILEDMPCVSTRHVGADGKRVEGFLYWYGGNKEEVKIVCVCHGSFLSPAEFIRHGGCSVSAVTDDGGGTINPLRHIVVKLPSSSL